jgi:fatty acid desaturase
MERLPKELEIAPALRAAIMRHAPLQVFAQSITTIGLYAGGVILAITINSYYVWGIVWLVNGFLLSGFLGAAHDCSHSTFTKFRLLNRVAGVIWCVPLLLNFSLYKNFHLTHHKYSGGEEDTEPNGLFPTFLAYLKHLPTTGFFTSMWLMSLASLRGRFPNFVERNQAQRNVQVDTIVLIVWVMTACVLTIIWPKMMAEAYWIPVIVAYPMIFLTSLPEHYGCDAGTNPRTNVRTIASNALFRWFFWNGNFHAEHHAHPGVPSCNLPLLHSQISSQFKFRERSYIRFHLQLISNLILGRPQNYNGTKYVADSTVRINYAMKNQDTDNHVGITESTHNYKNGKGTKQS